MSSLSLWCTGASVFSSTNYVLKLGVKDNEDTWREQTETISNLEEKREIKPAKCLIFCQQISPPFNSFVTWLTLREGCVFEESGEMGAGGVVCTFWLSHMQHEDVNSGDERSGVFYQEWSFQFQV